MNIIYNLEGDETAMIKKIRILYEDNIVWINLSKYLGISILLSAFVLLIDTKLIPVHWIVPSFLLTSVDLAKTILGALAGALLTITTFTFSTIMVVLTTYSSNFSPRVVENFLTDKVSMRVLGIFTGGFFYCIITLLFMRENLEGMVLSATVAVIYSIVCIIYFVIFVFSVSSSIQASKLINRLFAQSRMLIEKTLAFREKHETVMSYSTEFYERQYQVQATEHGYLGLINFTSMLTLISDVDCTVVIHVDVGTFITKNMELFTVCYNDADELPENLDRKIENCFTLTHEKSTIGDYGFSIQKIVEVALRALSPGINDPNTAIECIRFLGVILVRISESENKYSILQNEDRLGRILYEDFNFKKNLDSFYSQIIHYGKEDLSVMDALFEALKSVARCSSPANKQHIKWFSSYAYDKVKPYHPHPYDLEILESHNQEIQYLTGGEVESSKDESLNDV